jgi:hypothetical protein
MEARSGRIRERGKVSNLVGRACSPPGAGKLMIPG